MYLLNLSKTQWRQKRDNVKEKYKDIKRQRLEALKKKTGRFSKEEGQIVQKRRKTNIRHDLYLRKGKLLWHNYESSNCLKTGFKRQINIKNETA